MLLICVRHGQSSYNAEGRIQGQSGSGLSELGRRQGLAVAQSLRGQAIDAIYASPLARALETAQVIADSLQLPVCTDPRLMEINAGILQGQLRTELERVYPDVMARWWSGDADYRLPGGESRADLMRRGGEALRSIRAAGHRAAVVVSHGGLLVAALKSLVSLPTGASLDNCSITRLELTEDSARLLSFNDIAHLAAIGLGSKGEL